MSPSQPASYLVIFDLDNTLIVNQPAAKDAYKNAINYIAKQHGIYNQRFKLYNNWKKIVQNLKTSKNPQERQFEYSLRLLLQAKKIPDTYISQALAVFEKDYLEKIEPQAGANELLHWLKGAKFTTAVSTETANSQAKKKLKKVNLKKYIDILITSNSVGVMKPDGQYYELVIDQAGVSKNKTIVVGDKLVEDIEPAEKIGLATIQIPSRKFNLGEIKPKLQDFFESH